MGIWFDIINILYKRKFTVEDKSTTQILIINSIIMLNITVVKSTSLHAVVSVQLYLIIHHTKFEMICNLL